MHEDGMGREYELKYELLELLKEDLAKYDMESMGNMKGPDCEICEMEEEPMAIVEETHAMPVEDALDMVKEKMNEEENPEEYDNPKYNMMDEDYDESGDPPYMRRARKARMQREG